MRMKALLFATGLALLPLSPAQAETLQTQILTQLRDQGYSEMQVGRTFLGRVRIVAQSDGFRREIVFNPNTGEILRDLATSRGDGKERAEGDRPGLTDRTPDRDDDDDTDDDGDDDNDGDDDDGDNDDDGGDNDDSDGGGSDDSDSGGDDDD
jgi:hypothetical protein